MIMHKLKLLRKAKSGDIVFAECRHCDFAFAGEVDALGIIRPKSKLVTNHGDTSVSHVLFLVPTIKLELNVESIIK